MKEREIAMSQIQQQLREDLSKATSIIGRKILFDDSKNDYFNHLNIPAFDKNTQQQKRELIDFGLKHLHQFIHHFGDYLSAFHDRLMILNKSTSITDDLRSINRKVE